MNKILALTLIMLSFTKVITSGNMTEQYYLYVGTYTQNEREGICIYKFDATDGDLTYINTAEGIENPSYLAINSKKNLLIAVNEIQEFEGKKSGAVSSFSINPADGSLKLINQVASGGGSPCYISINKKATMALVANYSGGNVSIFPLLPEGRLQPYTDLQQHTGSGPVKNRQQNPHAHAIVLSPKEDFALAVDLGVDKVYTYAINEKPPGLEIKDEFKSTPGAGPRHLTFHPNKKFVFFINELNSTITSCSFDASTGRISRIQTVDALPQGFSGTSFCADIHVSDDGRFLYGSNRGHDSIVIYEIDQKYGSLSYVDHHSVHGAFPRNFMIDPTGKFLLVANQNSNNIVVFKIDRETGKLRANGVEVEVSKPVCLKMLAIK